MKLGPTLTIDEIIKLFKRYLGISIPKSSVYYYMHKHGFPSTTGWGRPSRWLKKPVLEWFKKQNKKIR